ncbi:MAG: tetratricopeptide repeat protein [Crocinitomicaceae bacterium]
MMRVGLILVVIFISVTAQAQLTEKYTSEYKQFYTAEELFEKAKFSAAKEEFSNFMRDFQQPNHPHYVKASYYNALCALYLYHANAEQLLLEFLGEYPESIYRQKIYFELGRYYFRKNKHEETIDWLSKVEVYDLDKDLHPEYYFKLGYAHFREDQLKPARDAFFEIIEVESQYQSPALYYYSHIAYTEKNYQTALVGFRKLENDPSFEQTVPTYISQILYLQGKYDELLEYAPPTLESGKPKDKIEMAHIIGDAFYRVGKYDEAVPYLEEYNQKSATTRDEDYQLAFAYFKSGQYMKSIRVFDKVAKIKDELGQVALYHIGEAYLKQDNFLYARNAFELAAALHFDKEIEEDALYRYAVLSYKLDYNPFDEAVEALQLYLKRYPESKRRQDIHQYLVNVYTTMKNYQSAMIAIENIEELDFDMKNAYQMMAYNYGVQLFENGQYLKSAEIFEKSRKHPIDPHLNALSYYWQAETHYKLKAYDKAIRLYRTFLEVPGSYGVEQHNDAYYNIAYCYFRKDDYDSAIQNFRTFTQDPSEDSKEKITDAYLRIGDAYFVNQEDDNAILFYQNAIAEKGGQEDYAKFQIGLVYGFKKEYHKKVASMLDVVKNHRNSTFIVPALYETGDAYRLMDEEHYDEAMKYYNQVVIDYPGHPLVINAIFQIASLYFVQQEYQKAEKQYLRILNEYDNHTKEKEALARLKDVYTVTNQPEKYIALVQSIGQDIDMYEQDTLLYFNAYDHYEDSSYREAIQAFDGYLKQFANPTFKLEANYYKGTAHYRLKEMDQAVKHYEVVLNEPTNIYTEFAALVSSEQAYKKEDYDKAIDYYKQLEDVATYPENKLTAQIGLMRSLALQEKYNQAFLYANKVLEDPLSLDNVITEAHYVIGNAEMERTAYEEAIESFRKVTERTKSIMGAKSQYHIAHIYHLQEEFKKSEDEIRILMKKHAGYDYWVAKALILQAKNSIGLEDYVQAEYTLNSVLTGYKIEDDGIIDEANEVMQVLKELKNKEKDIEDDTDNTIEIGGEE